MSHILETPITYLKGVGPKKAAVLEKELGVKVFGDLLSIFPFRYVDKSRIYKVKDVTTDTTYFQLRGKVSNLRSVGEKRTKYITAKLTDSSGSIDLVWFRGISWVKNRFVSGKEYLIFGKPSVFQNSFNFVHPEIEDVEDGIMLTTSRFDEKGKQMDIEFLGNLYVDQSLCRLEISSLEIAEFAVRYLTSIFGDALTFKRIVKTKLDLKPEHDIGGESNKPAQPVQSHPELIKEIEEKYYLSLFDEKIPALKNMTPREAREDPAALPLLIEWLKGLENMSERQRLEGEETVSISKIKKELGIDY